MAEEQSPKAPPKKRPFNIKRPQNLARLGVLTEWAARFLLLPALVFFTGLLAWQLYNLENEVEEFKRDPAFQARHMIYSLDIPENVSFAGEAVPLKNIEIYERFDRELTLNVFWHANTLLLIKRCGKWFPVIEPILRANGVPSDFKYIAAIESMFENRVSPRGAAGFWQLMPSAAEEFGLEINSEIDERFHAAKATEAACKYVKRTKKLFGNWTNTLAAYNVGMGSLLRSMQKQKVTNYYSLLVNTETSRYVFRLLAFKEIMNNPRTYGFQIDPKKHYYPIKTKKVKVTYPTVIRDLRKWALEHNITYDILKEYNPWLRRNTFHPKIGKTYVIEIPMNGYTIDEEELRIAKLAMASKPTYDPDSPEALEELGIEMLEDAEASKGNKINPSTKTPEIKEPGIAGNKLNLEKATPISENVKDPLPTQKDLTAISKEPERAILTQAPPTLPKKHIITKGETLDKIAKKYGVSRKELMRLNGITNPDKLKLGQELWVEEAKR